MDNWISVRRELGDGAPGTDGLKHEGNFTSALHSWNVE